MAWVTRHATGLRDWPQLKSPPTPTGPQTTRSFVTHDLRVNTALLDRVDDPVLRVALAMRQLHTLVSAVQAWFTARGVRHEGWKKGIGHIEKTDPAFLAVSRSGWPPPTSRPAMLCTAKRSSSPWNR
jgi:hypothetical protein